MMRQLLTLFLLLLMGVPLWSQNRFSLEGTVGNTVGTPETYSLSMVGRLNFSTALSAGIGVGIWNSGFSSNWLEEYDNQTATVFRISSNQTVPSFQVNLRGKTPLFTLSSKPIRFFIEPALHFLPITRRSVALSETYYTGTLNPVTNTLEYDERSLNPRFSTPLVTNKKSLFGWEVKGGLTVDVDDNMACAISCAYQHIDLFHTLRTAELTTHESNETIELQRFSPALGRFQLQLSFMYLLPSN